MAFNFKRSKNQPMSEINVTPFVDVMLVLLIIFMVTAPLLTVGVRLRAVNEARLARHSTARDWHDAAHHRMRRARRGVAWRDLALVFL